MSVERNMFFKKYNKAWVVLLILTLYGGGTLPSQSPQIKEVPVFMLLGKLQIWAHDFPFSIKSPCSTINFPAVMARSVGLSVRETER